VPTNFTEVKKYPTSQKPKSDSKTPLASIGTFSVERQKVHSHCRHKPHPLAADNPSNQILIQRFHEFLPSQIPVNFTISPLPPKILSWTSQVMQIAEFSSFRATRAQMRQRTGSGVDGFPFANTQASLLTPTSLLYTTMKANSSSAPSWACSGMLSGTSTVN
jgi:hypothetical protein